MPIHSSFRVVQDLSALDTPAFMIDEGQLKQSAAFVGQVVSRAEARVVYALKAFANGRMLKILAQHVDGFAASSLYEARIARDLIQQGGSVHITTPGFRADEIETIARTCDFIAFNSTGQWERFGRMASRFSQCGLRVNPQLSLVRDDRYNPSRRSSKLGVPLHDLVAIAREQRERLTGLSGLHFHTNCDSSDFNGLLATVQRLESSVPDLLASMEWINIGGGYLFDEAGDGDLGSFYEAVGLLRQNFGLRVFIEPGAAIVRKAGFLVSSVLDIFESEDKKIAVLDTTVNHMPEVFEYQYAPDVFGDCENGDFEYILAGCSCLAGDVFGEYSFREPLEIGSRVVFTNVGAYTLVKAHMFNGINLPNIYVLTEDGEFVLMKSFTYEDFASRWGVDTRVIV